MAKMTPTEEARYALQWGIARRDLPMAAQLEYDRLQAEMQRTGTLPPEEAKPDRFPSSPETRRQILEAIASGNAKYAKPFDKGQMEPSA